MSGRGSLIAWVCAAVALALALPALGAARTGGTVKRHCASTHGKGSGKRHGRPGACRRLTERTKAQSSTTKLAQAPAPVPTTPAPAGHGVTMTVLDGSNVTMDLGRGVIRTFPLSGTLGGYLEGDYHPGTQTTFVINRGSLSVGPADVLVDSCPSPAISRTNPATSVTLDPARPSRLVLGADGSLLMTSNIIIRVVLDLRGSSPCGGPTSVSGYADTGGTIPLTGHTTSDAAGLSSFTLVSHRYPLVLRECWVPGDPASPCMLAPTGLLSTATTDLRASLTIG